MSGRPEPHRDQRTIKSFKRTFNAAVLLWVGARVKQPAGPGRTGRLAAAGGAAAAVLLLATGHDPGQLLTGSP
jgi:hypothetical protein